MLYSTHCIACHTEHVHWRDKRLATEWKGLVKQVNRWQGTMGLQWTADDINSVAHYLNSLYYHFPAGEGKASADSPDRSVSHR